MNQLYKIGCILMMSTVVPVLTGCLEKTTKIACSDETGLSTLNNLLTEEIEKAIKTETGQPLSAIRSTIATTGLSVINIRTSKEDPNSTRVFCEGELTVKFAPEVINDAKIAMENSEHHGDVETLLNDYNYKLSKSAANSYETTITYNLQPTDDGKHIFAQLEDSNSAILGISDLLGWAVTKNSILEAVAEEKRIQAEADIAAENAAKAAAKAQEASDSARLESAKTSYRQATQRINEIWGNLSKETRDELRQEQKAINKQREASCKAESLSLELNETQQEAHRLECEVPLLDQRSDELMAYL